MSGGLVAALILGTIAAVLVMSRGVLGAMSSSSEDAIWVITAAVVVPLILVSWMLTAYSLRQHRRAEAVRARRADAEVIPASGNGVGFALSQIVDGNPKAFPKGIGSFYVVACDDQGIEFWGGPPKRPSLRYSISWPQVRSVDVGTARASRPVPGVALNLDVDGRYGIVTFAVCRPGALIAWMMLDPRSVQQVIDRMKSRQPAKSH